MVKAARCLFVFLCFISSLVWAQQTDLVDRTFTGVSTATTPQAARKDIQEQATLKISEDVIRELIGADQFLKRKTLIQSKIIRNSAKYIPVQKPSALNQEGDQYTMSVNLKLSLRDLKALLQSNGLLAENDSAPVVLPLIAWSDRVNGNGLRWWVVNERNPQSFLLKESRLLENALASSLQKNGFYSLKPSESGVGQQIPAAFQTDRLNPEEMQFLARYFNSPLAIDGQVTLEKDRQSAYKVELRLVAMQVQNGRTIADVSRKFVTESGDFEAKIDKKLKEVAETTTNDLAGQILEAWQRGSIGTSIVRLTIQGRSTLPQKEVFKERVRSQLTQVKSIRERFVSADLISFEVESSTPPSELVSQLEKLDISGKNLSKVSENPQEIVLRWAQ